MGNGTTKLERAKTIEDIAEVMLQYNEIARDAEWDVKSVLKDMYKDPSHFVFELIQNAEDTHATKVKMVLEKDKFLFMHNGKNFTLEDIKGVCKAGGSTKSPDKKGKFGIGFKAVYKITNSPRIYCKTYSFKIEEYNVPSIIDSLYNTQYETVIELPFDTGEDVSTIYSIVEKGLLELNQSSIMFLDYVSEIEISIAGKTIFLRKTFTNQHNFNGIKYNHLNTMVNGLPNQYHLFTTKIEVEVEKDGEINKVIKNISIAYPILDEEDEVESSSKLSVYFPTEQETFLKFLIDAPFDTTPTREQVDVQTPNNQKILNAVLSLYQESILLLKELNFLDLDIIYLLAINASNLSNEIYGEFYQVTQEVFNENELLPRYSGGYVKATESLLCRANRDFIDVLSKEDLKTLFDGRYEWIDSTGIKTDRSNDLRMFLTKGLGIIDVEFNTFVPRTSEEFFASKSDQWLMDFYKICIKNIENIRNNPKKIIRTQDGKMKSPFLGTRNKAEVDVFLPSKYVKNTEKVIKDSFLQDPLSMSFFKALGIEEADLKSSIEFEWIPFIQELTTVEDIKTSLVEVFEMIERLSKQERTELLNTLSEISFLPVFTEENPSDITFMSPVESYLYENNLYSLLKNQNKPFVVEEVSELYYTEYQSIFDELSLNTSFKIIPDSMVYEFMFPQKLKTRLKLEHPNKEVSSQKSSYFIDFQIDEFESVVNNLTPELSQYFWQKLTKLDSIYFNSEYLVRFKHTYEDAKGTFISQLIEELNESAWVFIDNKRCVPSEVTHKEFRDTYVYSNSDLERYIHFKTIDDYSSLTEASRQKLQRLESRSLDEIEEALSLLDETNRLKRLEDLEDLYLYNILVNTLQLQLREEEETAVQNVGYLNFHVIENQDMLFHILQRSNVSIEVYNDVSDLTFNKVQYFTHKLVQVKSSNEKNWISSLYQVLIKEEKITPKTMFTQMMTSYSQFDFSLNSDPDLLSIHFDYMEYYNNIDFLQFDEDDANIDLAIKYNHNLEEFKTLLKNEELSLDKIDECLNYQSNKSLLFLGVFEELVRRYKTNHLKMGEQKESKFNLSEKKITLKTAKTKRTTINHRAISKTGTKMDIGRTQSGRNVIGFHAEEFTYYRLLEEEGITNVEWKSENAPIDINANGRAGLGYDLSYEKDGKTYFVEVKGTNSNKKKLKLDFSRNEIQFAKLHGEAYQIILVTDMQTPTPTLNVIDNLFIHSNFDYIISTDSFLAEPSGYTIYLQID